MEKWPLKIINIKNIDKSGGRHGIFMTPIDEKMTGLEITHSVRFMDKFDKKILYSMPSFEEEMRVYDGGQKITIVHKRVVYNDCIIDLEKYSLFSENSIMDFDELFRKLDLLLVETI